MYVRRERVSNGESRFVTNRAKMPKVSLLVVMVPKRLLIKETADKKQTQLSRAPEECWGH